MKQKRASLGIQSDEDIIISKPSGDLVVKKRKQCSFDHKTTCLLINGMKNSSESTRKALLKPDPLDIVNICDDEDKLAEHISADKPGTGIGKGTPSKHIESTRQVPTNQNMVGNDTVPHDNKADITSLPQKSRLQDNPSLRNSAGAVLSSSTYSLCSRMIENQSPSSPEKHSTPSNLLDDTHHSYNDSDPSRLGHSPSLFMPSEYLPNTTTVRQSSPLQHPPLALSMDLASSSPNTLSNDNGPVPFTCDIIKDNGCSRKLESSDEPHGMIKNKMKLTDGSRMANDIKLESDNESGTNVKNGASIKFDSDSETDINVENDTSDEGTRINNKECDTIIKVDGDGRTNVNNDAESVDDIRLEINNKLLEVNPSLSSSLHNNLEIGNKDNADSFIPRRSARQRAKTTTPLYKEGSESDISDLDDSPTSRRNTKYSRKYNKTGPRKTRSSTPTPVEISDGETIEPNDTVLFTYPVDHSKGSVIINASDRKRLEPLQYLNDNVIDFYLKWRMDSCSGVNGHNLPTAMDRQTAENTHIFSTLFYDRLIPESGKSISYENVRKWTSDIDLFSKKFAIFPINENWHWYLVLVCNIDRCVSGTVELSGESDIDNRPLIFILDSLGGRQRKCVRHLTEYLTLEAESRRGIVASEFIGPKFGSTKVPKQNNDSDCGVYLLHFVDQFLKSPQKFIEALLVQDVQHEIWEENEIAQKRGKIQNLFAEVERQYSVANTI